MKKISIAMMVPGAILLMGCQQARNKDKMEGGMASDMKTGMAAEPMKSDMKSDATGDMSGGMKDEMKKTNMTAEPMK